MGRKAKPAAAGTISFTYREFQSSGHSSFGSDAWRKTGFSILILGAGKATRFKSEYPKLLHALAGRLMGEYVLRAAAAAGAERVYMIIGHQAEEMRKAFARPGLEFIEQKEQLGTGHALMVARPELERCPSGVVVALVGDVPLLQPETLRALVATHRKERAACTILSMRLDNPTGYGRIVRGGGKRVRAIVEEKVASAAQKKIREVNTGILCFSRQPLLAHLGELSRENAQKEYLLTDLIEIFNRHRLKVAAFEAPAGEAVGINDRAQLAEVGKTLRLRKAPALMKEGVTLTDPGRRTSMRTWSSALTPSSSRASATPTEPSRLQYTANASSHPTFECCSQYSNA